MTFFNRVLIALKNTLIAVDFAVEFLALGLDFTQFLLLNFSEELYGYFA